MLWYGDLLGRSLVPILPIVSNSLCVVTEDIAPGAVLVVAVAAARPVTADLVLTSLFPRPV